MLDSHHSGHHSRSFLSLLLEVAMIVVGVFLGLMAEQWREGRHEHALAQASLRNFRTEMLANAAQIRSATEYHHTLAQNLNKFALGKGPHSFAALRTTAKFQGIRTISFEHTAWDLAIATEALSYMKPEMAYAISRLYTQQQQFQTMENSFTQSAFAPTTFADPSNATGITIAMMTYLGDVNYQEPDLLKLYGEMVPKIDSALGDHRDRSDQGVVASP